MLPKAYIEQWKNNSPWQRDEFTEQDLILTRLLIGLYSSKIIADNLAFRGGTALHKIFLKNPYRYSEDLDFIQLKAGGIGPVITELRDIIKTIIPSYPKYKSSMHNSTLIYTYYAENPPNPRMKIKFEINTREHTAYDGINKRKIECESDWFTGSAEITTFSAEELLATKLRALYQRRKGRDLFDLWIAKELKPNFEKTAHIFKKYLETENLTINQRIYTDNLNAKIDDPIFQNDLLQLIHSNQKFDIYKASEYVKKNYISLI